MSSNRRQFVCRSLLVGTALAAPKLSFATSGLPLRFHHTHTNEKLDVLYRDAGGYRADALTRINHLLRDHRRNEAAQMDPALLDFVSDLYEVFDRRGEFQVISGYRSPATNAMLASKSNGVAKKSLHMQGRALDIRLPGVPTAELRDAAIELGKGGVGYYAKSDFIHIDTGHVRRW